MLGADRLQGEESSEGNIIGFQEIQNHNVFATKGGKATLPMKLLLILVNTPVFFFKVCFCQSSRLPCVLVLYLYIQ